MSKDRVRVLVMGRPGLAGACAIVLMTLVSPGSPSAQAEETPAMIRDSLPDDLREQIVSCWNLPADATGTVRIEARLRRDGSLDGEPRVVLRQAGAPGDQLAASALRALKRCAPFRLPPERYENWKDMVLTFDPSALD